MCPEALTPEYSSEMIVREPSSPTPTTEASRGSAGGPVTPTGARERAPDRNTDNEMMNDIELMIKIIIIV